MCGDATNGTPTEGQPGGSSGDGSSGDSSSEGASETGSDDATSNSETGEGETLAATLTHHFGEVALAAFEEDADSCVIWTLDNDEALYVQAVTLANLGYWHHSNWFAVPEDTYPGPDGYFKCADRGFTEERAWEYARMAAAGEPLAVLVQGTHPKRSLLQRFLDTPRSVLVGSASFWEGIDVPGDALQCVIIDKLPFPPPTDPLVQARSKALEAEGRDPFNDYYLSEAAIALKQGAGRLIRSETDLGLLVITDPRLRQMPYGRRLRAALPAMGTLDTEADALAWLDTLVVARPA